MVGDKVKKMKVPSKGGITKEDGLKEVGAFLKGVSARASSFRSRERRVTRTQG